MADQQTSEANACLAVIKPDCSKGNVSKAPGVRKALAEGLGDDLLSGTIKLDAKAVPQLANVTFATLEFAGVKFRTHAQSGVEYINYANTTVKKFLRAMPGIRTVVICEEKYSFTPDNFKAQTRSKRVMKDDFSVLQGRGEHAFNDKLQQEWRDSHLIWQKTRQQLLSSSSAVLGFQIIDV